MEENANASAAEENAILMQLVQICRQLKRSRETRLYEERLKDLGLTTNGARRKARAEGARVGRPSEVFCAARGACLVAPGGQALRAEAHVGAAAPSAPPTVHTSRNTERRCVFVVPCLDGLVPRDPPGIVPRGGCRFREVSGQRTETHAAGQRGLRFAQIVAARGARWAGERPGGG